MAPRTDSELDNASDAQSAKSERSDLSNISAIETVIDYRFTSSALLQQALTHRSFSSDHNERMEFLGDSVLNLSIANNLYRRFPRASEGDLSRMLANMVRGDTLAEIGLELGLGKHVRLGAGESNSGGRRRQSILADTVESIIAAVFLDANFDIADAVVQRLFEQRLNSIDPGKPAKDAKTKLQERMQAERQPLPQYSVVRSWGKAHQRQFEVSCKVALLEEPDHGIGGSRREAEQQAAQLVLERLGK